MMASVRPSFMRFVLLLVAGLTVGSVGVAKADVKEGDHFVELDIAKTAAGKKFRLKDMAGKWVLYTFGAKWCQPCHKELPAWDKVAPKYAGKVLFVAININNDPEEGKKFVESLKLKHMLAVFLPDDKSAAMKSYDPDHMPSTFVIDPKGIVRVVQYGYDSGDEDKLTEKLDKLIGG
jgi:thiol-disulfide isomerase/thioredoxin